MKGIKIDVEKREVSFIEIESGLRPMYDAIGNGCSCITSIVSYDNEDTMYGDDEALLNAENIKGGFIYPDWNFPIVSNVIILGTDEEGNSVDCKSTLEEIKSDLRFIPLENPNFQKYINQFS